MSVSYTYWLCSWHSKGTATIVHVYIASLIQIKSYWFNLHFCFLFTETLANNTLPTFNGNSYTCISINNTLLDLKFSFRTTTSQDGTLAYSNTTNGYIMIAIANGFITVRITQGNNVIVLEENDRLFYDGIWHDVTVQYDNQNVNVIVDNQLLDSWTSKASEYIGLLDNLCFGGIPNELVNTEASFFVGSISSLITLNGETIDIIENSVAAINIGNPDEFVCNPYLCSSNGFCQPDNDEFRCDCYFGYQGTYCEQGTIY